MNRNVPVNIPAFVGNEKKYLMDCIDTGWVSSDGEYVKKFEQGMASFVGRKYAFAICNGSAALETALIGLNIEYGSDVLLPDFTIISCAQAITKAGLNPIPVDCKVDTWNIDVEQLGRKITPKTKAIMVVHIYGLPVEMDEVIEFANKNGLAIIEDAAEAHGLTYKGKQCGSFGDVSIFSFYPNKHIVCGEGGMVLTDRQDIAERVEKARNLFFDCERRYIHEEIGSNFRMTNMQAALGLAQLEKISNTILKKRKIGDYYYDKLSGIDGIQLPVKRTEYADNIYWVFAIIIRRKDLSADDMMEVLLEKGIGTRHFFYPIHRQPCLRKLGYFENVSDDDYKNSIDICQNGLYIPSGVGMTEADQEYVVDAIRTIIG